MSKENLYQDSLTNLAIIGGNMLKTLPPELLAEYVRTIKTLEQLRTQSCAEFYMQLDIKRKELHDKILKHLGCGRDDNQARLELALEVETQLSDS
jgi:hypothetical protein